MSAPVHVETIPAGSDVARALEALAADAGIQRGRVQISGGLRRVRVLPHAAGTPFAIDGGVELVSAHGLFNDGALILRGVVSWSDRGLPRMAAGRIEEAISDGSLTAVAEIFGALAPRQPAASPAQPAANDAMTRPAHAAAESEPSPPTSKRRSRSAPAPRRRAAAAEDPHVDLTPEIDEIPVKPLPAPAKPKSTGGGGWAAAVAASKATDRGRARKATPTPDDLGFDVDGRPQLQIGDILIHPRFGRCTVARVTSPEKVKVRRPTGALFDMHLKVVHFRRQGDEDGKRVFALRIGRR